MSVTNKVLSNIPQHLEEDEKQIARNNIGAYEDKTAAGGIPKSDLASDVQSSLGKADSSVQSVTSNGQTLTKSAAGAIDIPKATDTKWGVVQVVNELKDNQNVIPNSRVIKEAVDGLSAALQARATFWTVQEWQTQSAQPGDPSKIYYVGPKGTGNDKYDMYEWRTKTNSYVLTDESTISLDGYWHGAPDIIGEDTLAPFVTSIEKNADDTVKYRTCSATVGDLGLPVFMDSGVITSADPHFMYPTVNKSTTFEEVESLVNAGYRPIFVPDVNSFGVHTRYILTGAIAKGYTPAFIFTALIPGSKYTRYFTSERMQTVICQHANDETEETWVWNDEVLIPNIPEPNQMGSDVGKILTVGEYGELYWDEGSDPLPQAGENQYLTSDANSAYLWRDIPDAEVVRAGTNNLHVSSASEPGKTIYSMSADYYQSRGTSTAYSGPGTVIINSATMNIESTNSGFGYKETLVGTSIMSASYGNTLWNNPDRSGYNTVNMTTRRYSFLCLHLLGQLRDDCVAEFWSNTSWYVRLNAEELRNEPMIAIPDDVDVVNVSRGSEYLPDGVGYAETGYNLYGYQHSDNVGFRKGELAWKDEIYRYVDEQVVQKEPLLPAHGGSYGLDVGKILTVSGNRGELGWLPIDRTLKIKKTSSTTDNELYVAANNAYNAGYIPVIEVNNNYGSYDYYYLVSKNSSRFDFEKSTTTFSNPLKGSITRMSLYENVLETSAVNLQRALSTSVTEFTSNYTRQNTQYYQSSSSTVHNDLSINLTIPAGAVALVIAKSLVSFIKDTSLKPYKAYLHIGTISERYSSAGYANFDAYGDGTGTTAAMECSRIYDNRGSDEALIVPLDTTVGGDDTSAGDEARRNMTGVIYYYNILAIAGL